MEITLPQDVRVFTRAPWRTTLLQEEETFTAGSVVNVGDGPVVRVYDDRELLVIPLMGNPEGRCILAEEISEECWDLCSRWRALHADNNKVGMGRVQAEVQSIIRQYCTKEITE